MVIDSSLKFTKLKEIGKEEGRNSNTFLALDTQLNAQLIVKEIEKDKDVESYFRESRIMYDVQHPNICEIQWASEGKEKIYLSMPFYPKGSLGSILKNKTLTVKEIIKISLDILTGLHYIHSKGLVHLDIKPSNVLINNNNKAVITDFGLSKYLNDENLVKHEVFYNTHLPPEALVSDTVDNRSDIYQAGLTMYRMCNRVACSVKLANEMNIYTVDELKEKIGNSSYPDRQNYREDIPLKLRKIINKMLEINPGDRYSSVLETMNDISKLEIKNNWQYMDEGFLLLDGITHIERIDIKNEDGRYVVSGNKKNKSSGAERKVSKYNYETTKKKDFEKFIDKVLYK